MYIDTHAHLDVPEFHDDCPGVIRRATDAGVRRIICPGITAASSARAVELAAGNNILYAAVGIQPNSCVEAKQGDWAIVEQLATHEQVVAIGETGLDRYWDFTPIELQRKYLERHMDLASRLDLPIILHCREAETDLLPMLRAFTQTRTLRGVIHSFSGGTEFAAECVELGLYLSFAGAVTYTNKKFAPLWEAAKTVPEECLLVETDSPYLTPHPLRGRTKRNEPALIVHTVERLAVLRGDAPNRMAKVTSNNAARLFSLDIA